MATVATPPIPNFATKAPAVSWSLQPASKAHHYHRACKQLQKHTSRGTMHARAVTRTLWASDCPSLAHRQCPWVFWGPPRSPLPLVRDTVIVLPGSCGSSSLPQIRVTYTWSLGSSVCAASVVTVEVQSSTHAIWMDVAEGAQTPFWRLPSIAGLHCGLSQLPVQSLVKCVSALCGCFVQKGCCELPRSPFRRSPMIATGTSTHTRCTLLQPSTQGWMMLIFAHHQKRAS